MTRKIIPQRKRFFFAVEGESEQSFVKFLQILSDEKQLSVHLETVVLNGGGYKTMLEKTKSHRARKGRNKVKTILIIDTDRAERGDDSWSIEMLTTQAEINNITVFFQRPNLEAILLRMMRGNERANPGASDAQSQLLKIWPNYKKPADARTLRSKFKLDDLLRAAITDTDLEFILKTIGFISN